MSRRRRFGRAGRCAPAACVVESFEPRRLLSAVVDLAARGIVPLAWHGQAAYARAGEWILELDGITGHATRQVAKIEALLDRAGAGAAAGTRVVRRLGADGVVLLKSSAAADRLLARLSKVGGFAGLQPNFAVSLASTIPTDPSFASLYGLHNTGQTGGTPDADIDAPEAWDVTTGAGGDVVVGVIDTGVDYTHPELAANVWTNAGEVAGNGVDDDANGYVDDVHGWDFINDDASPMDDHSHGTHVAGTIAAGGNNAIGVTGVAWGGGAKVMALKVMDAAGYGTVADTIEALNYATMMRTRGVNVRATNNSYGGDPFSLAQHDAIRAAGDAGMLFVAAAGNGNALFIGQNNDTLPFYPASYDLDCVISVAATDHNDARASFSNYGATSVDLGAPGVSTYSTLPDNRYGYKSGTSMAAPHVAGVAALVWTANPHATPAAVKHAILAGADPVASMAGRTVSGGRLNALGALRQLSMRVTGSSPAAGLVANAPLTEFAVHFSAPYDTSALAASALTVNGVPADSVTFIDADTAAFGFAVSPVTTTGPQTMAIAAGSVLRADGVGVSAWTATFTHDPAAAAPAALSAATLSSSQIRLTWSDNAANETRFDVERSTDGVTFAPAGTAGANAMTFTDIGLTSGRRYYYRVRAASAAGAFGYSPVASATTTAVAPTPGNGTGLTGRYYNNSDFTSLKLTRTDGTINFNWGSGSPSSSIGSSTFSVRWTGQVLPMYSETYTFHAAVDDGVRLWVNGVQIINVWRSNTSTWTGSIALKAGVKYNIQMDYYENTGSARAQLSWSSPSRAKQVIPKSQLFPTTGAIVPATAAAGGATSRSNVFSAAGFVNEAGAGRVADDVLGLIEDDA